MSLNPFELAGLNITKCDIASNSMHETSLNIQNMDLLLNLQQKQAQNVVQIGFPHTGNVTQHCTLCKQV